MYFGQTLMFALTREFNDCLPSIGIIGPLFIIDFLLSTEG